MEHLLNKITQGDCLEVMKEIPDKSINLIIIDPPYNIGKDKRWDKYKKEEYIEFMGTVFKECERVLKENGSFYWFHNDMIQIKDLMVWLEKHTSFIYKQFIVWNKRFNGARNKGFLDGFVEIGDLRNYQKMAEYCLFYTLQDDIGITTKNIEENNFSNLRKYFKELQESLGLSMKEINETLGHRKAEHGFYWRSSQWDLPTKETYEEISELPRSNNFHFKEWEALKEEYETTKYTFNNLKTHHSVWDYEIAEKQGHITPKPIGLIENIIEHSSNENDIVLDCFIGSGTTAVAALNTNRQFIGIEKEPEYVNIARERIKQQGVLPL